MGAYVQNRARLRKTTREHDNKLPTRFRRAQAAQVPPDGCHSSSCPLGLREGAATPRAALTAKALRATASRRAAANMLAILGKSCCPFGYRNATVCGKEAFGRNKACLSYLAVSLHPFLCHPERAKASLEPPRRSTSHGRRKPAATTACQIKPDLNMMNRRRSVSVIPSLPCPPPVANHFCRPFSSSPALGSQFSALALS